MDWSKVDEAFLQASMPYNSKDQNNWTKRRFVFPGAVLLVGRGGEVLYHKAVGCRSLLPEMTEMTTDIVFDVSSLTKVVVTTTLLMQLVGKGLLDINRRLSRVFQTFGTHGKEQMTIRHLLAHCSGYPATMPFYKQIAKANSGEKAGVMTSRGAVEMIYNEIFRARLENLPGRVTKYSDIGFILLGDAIEVVSGGKYLDKLAYEQIFSPLSLRSSGFIDLSKIRRRGVAPVTEVIAPTADCPWRGKILCGEVHDDNAWAMGGVAGHAGLFATAADLHIFASEMIRSYLGKGTLVERDVVREFWKQDGTVPESTWGLGWDTRTPQQSSSGRYFSKNAVGHLGYTGCSLWIDPERELDVILLSNRVHPSTENQAIREFRPLIHDLVMSTLGYAT